MVVAEDVTHMEAGVDDQSAATHPGPERELEVLSSPDLHRLVVGPEFPEVPSLHGKQCAHHGRRVDGARRVIARVRLWYAGIGRGTRAWDVGLGHGTWNAGMGRGTRAWDP